jgi:hypothetical protein
MKSDSSHPTIQSLALHAACSLAGGPLKLARHLGVPFMSLRRWLEGKDRQPAHVFVACADIVLFHERHLTSGRD